MINEAIIAEAVKKAIAEMNTDDKNEIKVGVSARHVHLSQEDLETLFGKGAQLTVKKQLMGREYASDQLVTLVGPSLRAIEKVRVL